MLGEKGLVTCVVPSRHFLYAECSGTSLSLRVKTIEETWKMKIIFLIVTVR